MPDAFEVTIAIEVLVVDCEQKHIGESRMRRTIECLGKPSTPLLLLTSPKAKLF